MHPKNTPRIDEAMKKQAGMHDGPMPPVKEGDEVSFEIEEDKGWGDKTGRKKFVATRVLVVKRGTIAAKKNSVVAEKVLGTVLAKASKMSGGNKGTGRTTSLNGTISVDLSSVKSMDKMFPLVHARIWDFNDSKATRVAIPIKNQWEDLKKHYLSTITAELNMVILKEDTDGKKKLHVTKLKKHGSKRGSKGRYGAIFHICIKSKARGKVFK